LRGGYQEVPRFLLRRRSLWRAMLQHGTPPIPLLERLMGAQG